MTRSKFHLTLLITLIVAAVSLHAQSFSGLYNFGTVAGDPNQLTYPGIVAQGRDGNLYSTSDKGGPCCGTVFMITPAGNVTSLHDFGQGNDGSFPQSGLTLGTDGNLYGTTSGGGSSVSGTVFTMSPSGNVTILYNFSRGSDGGGPYAPPVEGNDGNFYGVAVLV